MTGKRRAEPPPKRGRHDPQPAGGGARTTAGGAAGTGVIAPIKSRRQHRADRKARQRRIGGAGIVAIVVVAAVVVAAVVFAVHKAVEPSKNTSPPIESATLLQVTDRSGASIGGILLAHNASADAGVEVLVPASLITSTCDAGEQSFGSLITARRGAAAAAATLSTVMGGVTIGSTWTLTLPELSKLVDSVGGVTVNVDTNVTRPGRHGTTVIEIQRGSRHLIGPEASEYAAFRDGRDEDASGQLARMQSVVQATIDALPKSVSKVSMILSSLGSTGQSTMGADRLAMLLLQLASDDSHPGGVYAGDLPVTKLGAPGPPSYEINSSATAKLVQEQLAPFLPPQHAAPLTVELQNGLGTPGLVPAACTQLEAAGVTATDGGNATFSNQPSEILVKSRTIADAEVGRRVAGILHLPDSDVAVNPIGQNVADVIVVLGRDYKIPSS